MKRPEILSRLLIMAATLGAVAVPLFFWTRTPIIHAQMAEGGGWNPDVLQAEVGKPLHLRFTSDDVLHGFAVGQTEMDALDIETGKVTDIELTFDKPGIYTFFCTRSCGLNHWRMRGTIEVSGSSSEPEPATDLKESKKWDIVSYIWESNTTPKAFTNGVQPFAQNCAACHGENGAGDGVFADDLAKAGEASMQNMTGANEMAMQTPVDFTDSQRMLGASPALLQGKILRGGMGTGMPMWGSIFTEEQIWDLIAYIYSFQFEYH